MTDSTNNIQINFENIKETLEALNDLSIEKVREIVKGFTVTILGSVTIHEFFKTLRVLNSKA